MYESIAWKTAVAAATAAGAAPAGDEESPPLPQKDLVSLFFSSPVNAYLRVKDAVFDRR